MKLYRVVPDCFLIRGKKLEVNDKIYMESIYYNMGYTTFSIEKRDCYFNNLKCENKQGKYFFIFAEDAIRNGNFLYQSFHELIANLLLIEEYDIPEDIVMKNIGVGDYTRDMPSFCLESFIEKKDFGSQIISTDQIDENGKLKYLVEFFKNSLERMKEYERCIDVEVAIDYYSAIFNTDILSSTIGEEQIKKVLLNSKLYSTFLRQYRELILSPFITKKIVPLNTEIFHYINLEGEYEEQVNKYYQNLGIRCNFYSKEHEEFKNEIIENMQGQNSNNETVRKLLKERNYIS